MHDKNLSQQAIPVRKSCYKIMKSFFWPISKDAARHIPGVFLIQGTFRPERITSKIRPAKIVTDFSLFGSSFVGSESRKVESHEIFPTPDTEVFG